VYQLDNIAVVAKEMNHFECDCAITVALKISDDSCKMDEYEKHVFMLLYDALDPKETDFFEKDVFDIIQKGRNYPSAHIYSQIKERREAAMDFITRPRMKAFKAEIRKRLST
jgi:hypothetical protein